MFDRLRASLARAIAPSPGRTKIVRMYAGARPSRLWGGYVSNSSADTELVTSLTNLRNKSRQLIRDASYALNAKRIFQNNVIGTGIGMQSNVESTRGTPNKAVNDMIEEAWEEWACAENCHVGGALHFHDIERMVAGEMFEAGEILIRLHPFAVGRSNIPLALEVVEPERLADETDPGAADPENMVRMGVEVNNFYRPMAYWLRERHQGELRLGVHRTDRYERVSADFIYHLFPRERWPQTRGVPALHTVIRKLLDVDGYSEAEIVAARGASNYFASLKAGDDPQTPVVEEASDGTPELVMEPGTILKLGNGEELDFHTPNRPNAAMDGFMKLMIREIAAGVGQSYASLSRDYSASNYSSSRLALLDDRDLWRVIQLYLVRNFRSPLHAFWLQQAVLSGALRIPVEAYANDTKRYCLAKYKPRGWSWIDPTAEVEAYASAVRNGFTDVGDVIAKTGDGRDLEDVLDARRRELDMMKERDLVFDTDPSKQANGAEAAKPVPAAPFGGTGSAPGAKQPAAAKSEVIHLGGRQ